MKKILTSTAGVFLILGILIAVNAMVGRLRVFRVDLTEENLYTLSEGTRGMLAGLERDVALKFYFSTSSQSTPVQVKQYAQRIKDLLREYSTHAGGRIILETYDPKPDSDEEEWARKYGISPQGMSLFGGDPLYLGIAAVSGTREAAIPFVDPGAEPQLEYLITRLIHEVSLPARPRIGILSSMPVMGAPPMMPYARPQPNTPQKWVFVSELERLYQVTQVEPTADAIDDDLAALLVIHPKELSDATLFAIDQYLMKGGHLLVFQDPMCLADPTAAPSQFGPPQSASDLNRLTEAWGLRMSEGQLVGDLQAATRLSIGQGQVDRVIAWLSLREALINREEVATSSLEFLMMPLAGALTVEEKDGISHAVLAHSSGESGLLNTFQALGPSANAIGALQRQANLPLMVRLQGSFVSAFPDGAPADPSQTNQVAAASSLTESVTPGAVLVVSDADMLADQNSVQAINAFGQRVVQPINDNLNLVLNLVEQLAGSEALIGLRSRGTYERPFTKVLELQQKAQAQYQAREQELQGKLQEAQTRLNELQSGKTSDQKLIISPEQQAEIDRFNQEVVSNRRELREVRKNLRSEIETLGTRLKVINIAGIPLVVAICGTVYGLRRKKKSARVA